MKIIVVSITHKFWKLLGEFVNMKLTHDGFSGFLKEIGSLNKTLRRIRITESLYTGLIQY